MKTIVTLLVSAYIVPVALSAQPTITQNEYYEIGDVIQMVNCDTTGLNAGAAGAGITWNFTALTANGSYSTTTIAHDTSVEFGTSNLLETLPNGTMEHVQENSTDNYVNGIYNPATGLTATYLMYDEAKRPFTYNSNYADTYYVSIPSVENGKGYLVATGDAYGTLMLPTGTFSNVLRVKKFQFEQDTASGGGVSSTNTTSYFWFDGVHPAPLLRIDSVQGAAAQSRTIMYLASSTGIVNTTSKEHNYNAFFEDNTLQLTGNFEHNSGYQVTVYDMIGSKLYTGNFTGDSQSQRFDVGRQVAPGIYIVSIARRDDPSSNQVIKIIKH